MPYTKTNWVDGATPLNEANLDKMELGIETAQAAAEAAQAAATAAASGAVPLTQKAAANGVATLNAQTRIPSGQVMSYGASPPSTPIDGDLWAYPVSTGVWMFRYNAGSGSAYKWEFMGGPDVFQIAELGTSSAVSTGWNTSTPTLTIPRAGDYRIDTMASFGNGPAGGFVQLGAHHLSATPPYSFAVTSDTAAAYIAISATYNFAGLSTSDIMRVCLYANVGGFTAGNRVLRAVPIRVA